MKTCDNLVHQSLCAIIFLVIIKLLLLLFIIIYLENI